LQPFVTYSLGGGWFIRSQPQMVFDWKTGQQQLPLDLGAGRVFTLGRQNINVFVEPFWNVTHNGPAPKYGVTFGASLLYPNFWHYPRGGRRPRCDRVPHPARSPIGGNTHEPAVQAGRRRHASVQRDDREHRLGADPSLRRPRR